MQYLKAFDFYYSPITLAFKGDYTYKTAFGGLLTILTTLILATFTFIFYINLINKTNFNIISSTSFSSLTSFDFTNYPFMLALFNETDLIEYDEKLFNIELIGLSYQPKQNDSTFIFDTKKLKLEKCHELQKRYKNYIPKNRFNFLNFSEYLCISPEQNMYLYGRYGDLVNGFKGIRFNVNKCNNQTLKNNNKNFTCFPEDIINQKLKSAKFIYHFLGFSLNHYSKNNYIVREEISGTHVLSMEIVKGFLNSFSKVNYYVDTSIFTNSRNKTEFFLPGQSNMDVGIDNYNFTRTKHIDNNTIGFISFNMDNNLIEYHKSYQKFSDFIASLGGIFNVVLIITQFLNKYISNKIKIIDIIETLSNRKKNIKKCPKNNLFKYNNYNIDNINNNKNMQKNPEKKLFNSDNGKDISFLKIVKKNKKSINPINSSFNIFELNNNFIYKRYQTKINKINKKWYYYLCPVYCLKKIDDIFCLDKNFTNCLCVESAFDVLFYSTKLFNYLDETKVNNIINSKKLLYTHSAKFVYNNIIENES